MTAHLSTVGQGVAYLAHLALRFDLSSASRVYVEVVDTALESVAPRMILDEWVFAYGYALAPIAVSVLLMLHAPTSRAFLGRSKALPFVLGVWMIVPMIALNIWSVHNRGGYTAALAPMVAIGLGAASLAVEAMRRGANRCNIVHALL